MLPSGIDLNPDEGNSFLTSRTPLEIIATMFRIGRLHRAITLLISLAIFSFGFSFPQDGRRSDYERGIALYNGGKYKEAVEAFKRSVQLDPTNADALNQPFASLA